MNDQIKRRFSKDILQEAANRYGVSADDLRLLGDSDSFVYDFEREGQDRILRVNHSTRLSPSLVRGELDWINHLVKGGASVCDRLLSEAGLLVEEIDDEHGEAFVAAAFIKAAGNSPSAGEWTPVVIERFGALMGRMHQLTRSYSPSVQEWRRPEWNDDPIMLEAGDILSGNDESVLEEFNKIVSMLAKLPKDRDSYGLIHQDAHGQNLTIDPLGRIMLFDCSDCIYSWFVNDIAIVLFYTAMWEEDIVSFAGEFMRQFLKGYFREVDLDLSWLTEIPKFLKMREITLFAVMLREFALGRQYYSWLAGFMQGRKEKIEQGIPYIDFDFETLMN